MTNAKVPKWKHTMNKNKMVPSFLNILGQKVYKNYRKNEIETATKGPDMDWTSTFKTERKKFC